jgi:hypothetical protein
MRKSRSAAGTASTASTVNILAPARLTGEGQARVQVEFPCRDDEEGHVFVTVRQTRAGLTTITRGESVTRKYTDGIHTVLVTTHALEKGPGLRVGKAVIEARVYTWDASTMGGYDSASRIVSLCQ